MFCPKCGKQLEDTALFCPGCGNRMSGSPKPQQPETTAYPAYPQAQQNAAPAAGYAQQSAAPTAGYAQQSTAPAGYAYPYPTAVKATKVNKKTLIIGAAALLVFIIIFAVIIGSCSSNPLIGRWVGIQITYSSGSVVNYDVEDEVWVYVFNKDGTYTEKYRDDDITEGTYTILENNQVIISESGYQSVVWEYSIASDGKLTFTDGAGAKITLVKKN